MAILAKFASKKLLVVLGTVAVALLPTFTEKITEAIDWRIYAIVGGYIVANVAQKVIIAWITTRRRVV